MVTSFLSDLLRTFHRQERGQALWFAAALIAVFGGMIAFAVDLGSLMADRRDHQNAADAIALAASLELPDQTAALAKANEWAVKNDIDPADMTVTFTAQNPPAEPNPKVEVTVRGSHDFAFARLIGVDSATVEASAAAIKTSAAGGDGFVPLSITDDALAGVGLGDSVVLKYDANNILTGNTGPVRIDNPGGGNCNQASNHYCSGVMYGSENVVCAQGADNTYCNGPSVVDREPGNKVGDTRTAIDFRLNNTDVRCDEFGEVFEDDPTTDDIGAYRIVQECNPFLSGSYESRRVLIIPVVDQFCNGSCQVTIVDFALFFLEGFANGGCTGNDCEVIGRFVRVNQNVGLLAGTFNETSFNQFVRLVR